MFTSVAKKESERTEKQDEFKMIKMTSLFHLLYHNMQNINRQHETCFLVSVKTCNCQHQRRCVCPAEGPEA